MVNEKIVGNIEQFSNEILESLDEDLEDLKAYNTVVFRQSCYICRRCGKEVGICNDCHSIIVTDCLNVVCAEEVHFCMDCGKKLKTKEKGGYNG